MGAGGIETNQRRVSAVTDLARFDNSWYRPGRSRLVQALWFFCGLPLLRASWMPSSMVRRALLGAFGARVGRGVVIKPGVRVKYPWLLEVGENSWLGEDCWIDNLGRVSIGANVCVSQGAYLCTGNHDWSDPAFGLLVKPITLRDGVWVGARAVIAPGVEIGECGVAAAGSVVAQNIPPYEIHAGNPARFVRRREFRCASC
jgi:putative colanic acid biosynthesis acetyltransferase WcaF